MSAFIPAPSVRLALLVAAVGAGMLGAGAYAGRSELARLDADTAMVSRSIIFFEDRLVKDPANPVVAAALLGRYVRRFQTGADLQDLARAEQLGRAALPLTGDSADAWATLSGVLLMRHAFADAAAAADRAVGADPHDPDALGARFDAALATGQYAAAESALAGLRPATLGYQVRLATWLDVQGYTAGAYATLRRVCERLRAGARPAHTVAWCLTELGGLAHGARGPRAAATHFREALAVLPGYRGAVEGLADLAHARGAWARAERLYRQIAADAHPDLYLRLAELRAARGDPEGTRRWEAAFLRAALVPGGEPLYAHPLALHFAERAETRARAVAIAGRDVARRPAAESWEVLSWALYRAGRPAEALAASDSSLARVPASATGAAQRALVLRAVGAVAAADSLWASLPRDPSQFAPHVRRALEAAEVSSCRASGWTPTRRDTTVRRREPVDSASGDRGRGESVSRGNRGRAAA